MARMTNEEKRLAAVREQTEREERERFSYTTQLLACVGRAMNVGMNVTANVNAQNQGMFVISGEWDTYKLPLEYTPDAYRDLENIQCDVANAERAADEARRLEELRKQALAKLSKEERLALGIGSAI